MHRNERLSISSFSKLCGIARKTLIFYDRIGLFKPGFVADNGYRYYYHSQLDTIGVIHIFKELGMPLEEIRAHLDKRTPDRTLDFLRKQEIVVQTQIDKLERTRQMIRLKSENIEQALQANFDEMFIISQPKIPIMLSRHEQASKQQYPEELWGLWDDFQERLETEQAPIGYPNGVIIDQANLLNKDGDRVAHMFSRMQTKVQPQAYMPEGYYLVSYSKADYGDTEKIYPRIFEHIERQRYVIAGSAYEEYLQDEVSLQQPEEYVVRIMVQVHGM